MKMIRIKNKIKKDGIKNYECNKKQVKEKVLNFIYDLNNEEYYIKELRSDLKINDKVENYDYEILDYTYNKGVSIKLVDYGYVLLSYDTIIASIDNDKNLAFYNKDMISKTTKKHIDLFTLKHLNITLTKDQILGKEHYCKYYDSDYYHFYY